MAIEDLTVDFTRCRTIGHAWFEADSDWAAEHVPGTPVTLRCERCGTERREMWDRTGFLNYRTYIYPEGYCQEWGGNFPTKDDFRLALLAIQNRKPRNGRAKKSA